MSLAERATRHGIATRYQNVDGTIMEASDETLRVLLAAMGADDDAGGGEPEVHVVEADAAPDQLRPDGDWRLTFEDESEREGKGPLPALPLGRHRLRTKDGAHWLIAAPPALPLPPRGWGVTLPLYGLRGPGGGLGDYHDLAVAARRLGALGAGFVGINPIHAGFPSDPGTFSPYSPSHRRRFAVHHIHVDGEAETGTPDGLVDYAAAIPARLRALRSKFESEREDAALDAFLAEGGERLWRFATYEALAERHGPRWDGWPAGLQAADAPEVADFARDHAASVRFHAWLQMQAEGQLAEVAEAARAAGMRHGLYLDLAVGTHPHGAETWADPESFARGVSLGAPPDAFSKNGQNWGVAPLNPRALIRTGFAALAATIRTQLRFAGMIRIDHILGFERAFWVPDALPGAYVAMPRDAMLAVVRIEAARAGAVVVGEDLGHVPEGLTETLAAGGILGCAVAQFEPDLSPEDWPEAALASFGTHDLPTWEGWRGARDIAAREERVGLTTGDEARAGRADEVARFVRTLERGPGGDGTQAEPSVDDMHAFLAATRSRLVAVQAEDALSVLDQPNLPGTVGEYPNWQRPLPVPADDLETAPGLKRAAEVMAAAGR